MKYLGVQRAKEGGFYHLKAISSNFFDPETNLSFDGQEDPTLTTRLEAFVEQVGARQRVSGGELVAH